MDHNCPHIDRVLELVEANGNVVVDFGKWTKVEKVIFMRDKLSAELKEKIHNELRTLEYWKSERTPYDPANEGYLCKECSAVIVFPI